MSLLRLKFGATGSDRTPKRLNPELSLPKPIELILLFGLGRLLHLSAARRPIPRVLVANIYLF